MKLETVTFSPIGQEWDWISIGFGLITLFGILVLIYQFSSKKNPESSENSSYPIIVLIALATALAAGGFVYSSYSSDQLNTVEISTEFIRTPFGECKVEDVKSISIYPDINPLPPSEIENVPESYLIIEEINGHRHPLSSETYDITPIYKKLLEVTKRKSSFLI